MFCNRCGQAVSDSASICVRCGTPLPRQSQGSQVSADDRKVRRWAFFITVAAACLWLIWDVLAGLILFRDYTFFEGVVVSLLVIILSEVWIMRADFDMWSEVFRRRKDEPDDKAVDHELLSELRTHLKGIFFSIAVIMAIIKLVLLILD